MNNLFKLSCFIDKLTYKENYLNFEACNIYFTVIVEKVHSIIKQKNAYSLEGKSLIMEKDDIKSKKINM